MVTTRSDLIERSCTGKKAYPSFGHARFYAEQARARRQGRITPYRCVFCSCWHLGHPMTLRHLIEFVTVLRGLEPFDETHNRQADKIGRNGHQ